MIKPHGSEHLRPLFSSDAAVAGEAESLPALLLNSAAAANAVMLGAGYFTPLAGYMNIADAMSVADNMYTTDSLFWPVPVLNRSHDISAIQGAGRIALRDPNVAGNPVLAVQQVDAIEVLSDAQLQHLTTKIFRSTSTDHPGVQTFRDLGKYVISGPIQVLNYSYFATEFPDTFRTAVQIRVQIKRNGSQKFVAFQIRTPMDRAHELVCKVAL